MWGEQNNVQRINRPKVLEQRAKETKKKQKLPKQHLTSNTKLIAFVLSSVEFSSRTDFSVIHLAIFGFSIRVSPGYSEKKNNNNKLICTVFGVYLVYLLCVYYWLLFSFSVFFIFFLFPDSHFITSRDTYSCNRQTSFLAFSSIHSFTLNSFYFVLFCLHLMIFQSNTNIRTYVLRHIHILFLTNLN